MPAWPAPRLPALAPFLAALATASFLLLCHNYVVSLLPERRVTLAPEQIRPLAGSLHSFAYAVDFHTGDPDSWRNPWSRTRFFENDVAYARKLILLDEIQLTGGDRWAHQAERVVFSTTDNTDPRTNGRRYSVGYIPLCSAPIGLTALLVWLGSLGSLLWLHRNRQARATAPPDHSAGVWRPGTAAAAIVFLAGLYLNTGTMAPYGNTFIAHRSAAGNLYNIDHEEFRKTTLMLDGAPRAAWENGIFHRRILVALLAWPVTRLTSFEDGGLILSTLLCAVSFVGAVTWASRRIGARGARITAWLLALYPGFAYWFGIPYAYLVIAPLSVALVITLAELERTRELRTVVWLSLGLGIANLAYDFLPLFAPASLLVLVGQRRWRDAACSLPLQVLPVAGWLLILRFGYQLPLSNSNTAAYSVILQAYSQIRDVPAWLAGNSSVPDILIHVFVGSNFLFLPALFLATLGLAPWTSGTRLTATELSLLGCALLLFLFNNLAPEYAGAWQLRGSWISRLYQPIFPVFIFFIARAWEHLDRTHRWPRLALGSVIALAMLGNTLVILGPVLNNPGRISEMAFLKFYSHSDFGASLHYQGNLNHYGRHPWGFVPKPR